MLDFSAIATNLNVQPQVIERIHEIIPYQESLQSLISGNNTFDFWRQIDNLPPSISIPLHGLDASVPCTDRDFPPDSIDPIFQDFYGQISHHETSVTPFSFTKIYPQHINEILSSISGWSKNDNDQWCVDETVFDMSSLCYICEASYYDSKPWLFVPDQKIRASYIEFDLIFERFENSSSNSSEIAKKLRTFAYTSSEDFINDVKAVSPNTQTQKISSFESTSNICPCLNQLIVEALNVIPNIETCPEYSNDEWIVTRSHALNEQASLPFAQRKAFVLTPQMLQARNAQLDDQPFEPCSLAELIFSSSRGDTMPLPYTNCKAELPSGSPFPFCRSVFRKFVARQLMHRGYQYANESCIDILTDFVINHVKTLATTANTIRQENKTTDAKSVFNQALNYNKIDVHAARLNKF